MEFVDTIIPGGPFVHVLFAVQKFTSDVSIGLCRSEQTLLDVVRVCFLNGVTFPLIQKSSFQVLAVLWFSVSQPF